MRLSTPILDRFKTDIKWNVAREHQLLIRFKEIKWKGFIAGHAGRGGMKTDGRPRYAENTRIADKNHDVTANFVLG